MSFKSTMIKLGAAFVVGAGIVAVKNAGQSAPPPANKNVPLCDEIRCDEIVKKIADDPLFKDWADFAEHYGPIIREEGRKKIEQFKKIQNPSP